MTNKSNSIHIGLEIKNSLPKMSNLGKDLFFCHHELRFSVGFPCPEINEEKNRHHEPINSLYRIGDKVFFTCKSGYTLSNSDTKIECVSHETNFTIGKWSFSFPSCIGTI